MKKTPEIRQPHYETKEKNPLKETKNALTKLLNELDTSNIPEISDNEFSKLIPNKKEKTLFEYSLNQLKKEKEQNTYETIKQTKTDLYKLKQEILDT